MRVAIVETMGTRLVSGSCWLITVPDDWLLDFRLLQGHIAGIAAFLEVTCFQVEWMTAVQVAVNWVANVRSIDGGSEVVVETETGDTFTKTVEIVVFWQTVYKFNELVLIDELSAFSSEDDISSRVTTDIKPERWLVAPYACVSKDL